MACSHVLHPLAAMLTSRWGLAASAGFFFEPTVFTDVRDDMYVAREESFGPVMIVSKFQSG